MRLRWLCALIVLGTLALWTSVAGALAPGNFDPSFGTGGVVLRQLGGPPLPATEASAVALQPDGKIVIAGYTYDSHEHAQLTVVRLNGDGSLDTGFAKGGVLQLQLGSGPGGFTLEETLALQPDGKILIGGFANVSETPELMVVRLNGDGSLDTTFGSGGAILTSLASGINKFSDATSLLPLPDGKIVVGGDATSNGADQVVLARLNGDGSFDESFGTAGKTIVQLGFGAAPKSFVQALALQPDGKIVGAGLGSDGSENEALLAVRLDENGALDPSFGSGGRIVTQFGSGAKPRAFASAIALQGDGRIVLGGYASDSAGEQQSLLARLKGDGSLDSSFGSGGAVLRQLGAGAKPRSSVSALAVQPNGSILAGGSATDASDRTAFLVTRIRGDGSFDSSFGAGGNVLRQFGAGASPFSIAKGLALQPDGKLIAVGAASDSSALNEMLVVRLIADLPPAASFTASPNPVQVGQPVSFDGSSSSDDGAIVRDAWSFGDGAVATGATATHAYAAPGTYAVSLTVGDDYGFSGASVQTITVTPRPSPIGPLPPPALSELVVRPGSLRAAARGASITRKTGATVSYRDSEAASTTFTVRQLQSGVKKGRRCVKPSTGKGRGHARHCRRYVPLGSFVHDDLAGRNRFHFSGRVRGRKLRPGSYQLAATARAHGVSGNTLTTGFRVLG